MGREVSDDYLEKLLNRNGWKKKMPKPHHPKRTMKNRKHLKKLPEKLESITLAFPQAQSNVYPLLFFEDEASYYTIITFIAKFSSLLLYSGRIPLSVITVLIRFTGAIKANPLF